MDTPKFTVVKGPHGMPSLSLRDPDPEVRTFVRKAVTSQWMDDVRYELRTQAGAFLQCDYENYVLVEFWQPDYQPFVDWLNENIEAYLARSKDS